MKPTNSAFCVVETAALLRALALPGERVTLDYAPTSSLNVPLVMINDTMIFPRATGADDYGQQSFTLTVTRDKLRDALPTDIDYVTLSNAAGVLAVNGTPLETPPAKHAGVNQSPRYAEPSIVPAYMTDSAVLLGQIGLLIKKSKLNYGTPRILTYTPPASFALGIAANVEVAFMFAYTCTRVIKRDGESITTPTLAALTIEDRNVLMKWIGEWYTQAVLA